MTMCFQFIPIRKDENVSYYNVLSGLSIEISSLTIISQNHTYTPPRKNNIDTLKLLFD